jgi:hypothetical protein
VIARHLYKFRTDGSAVKTEAILELNVSHVVKSTDVATPKKENTDVQRPEQSANAIVGEERLVTMEMAVIQGRQALENMTSAPSSVERVQNVIDASKAVNDNINSIVKTWDPLLDKLKIFTEIVNKIAEVGHRNQSLTALVTDSFL